MMLSISLSALLPSPSQMMTVSIGLFCHQGVAAAWVMLNIIFLSTVVTVRLENTSYRTSEEFGTITLCAVLEGSTERDLQVTLSTLSNTAAG